MLTLLSNSKNGLFKNGRKMWRKAKPRDINNQKAVEAIAYFRTLKK